MKIAITGHRPNKLGNDYDLKSNLILNIRKAIVNQVWNIHAGLDDIDRSKLTLIIGMALGIDTLFALIAIELGIPFIAAIPFRGQENKWVDKSKKLYYELLSKANKIVICSTGLEVEFNKLVAANNIQGELYNPSLMQKRNEWMVDNCDILIAVWNGTTGGTANCVKYAEKKIGSGNIIYINPNDYK